MEDQVGFYISAASDLDEEREALGRAVTEIPVDLRWRISQSPRRNDPLDGDAVADADAHVLLLGGDIRAPIGTEWQIARRVGRTPTAFLRQGVGRTPAAQEFVRFVGAQTPWQFYSETSGLRRQVLEQLSGYLLEHAMRFRLTLLEVEQLQAWRKAIADETEKAEEPQSGAGASGIILSAARFVPSDGVLIRPQGSEP